MIDFVKVKDREEGNLKAHNILKNIVDKNTLLALSGGTSVDYRKMFVEPPDVNPGAICVVDERYGKPFHKDSNELLLKNQGVKECTDERCIEAHKILIGKDILATGENYNRVIKELFMRFPKKVGVAGIGADLHTAGIFPYSQALKSPDYVCAQIVEDRFPKRITLTLKAFGEFQNFAVLVFGEGKRKALKIILDEGENDMQKYPAIFYRKISVKVFLIADISP